MTPAMTTTILSIIDSALHIYSDFIDKKWIDEAHKYKNEIWEEWNKHYMCRDMPKIDHNIKQLSEVLEKIDKYITLQRSKK